MGIFSFFNKKKESESTEKVGGMEDFMTLIRVYYQAVLASNLGITNISMLPDMATFKRTLKVPTQNNKLGIAERNRCKKMLEQIYNMEENFFKEIDASIKKNCKNMNSVQPYLFAFQGFNNDLMMLVGNLLSWKIRIPSFFHKALRGMTEKTIHDILTKNNWKDEATFKTVYAVRQYKEKLGYSEQWMIDYVYKIVSLAKKEPRPQAEDTENK
ncbi:MAG: hypothetical protein IJN24_05775 [Bacteroidaceae bacterium]|nr:hypothetical protein [Bacteroidaceae bacterium]MBQ6694362.1 hypothetical protein [Bacteroidaceae bacterium]